MSDQKLAEIDEILALLEEQHQRLLPRLTPEAAAEVQRILDRAARRILAERLRRPPEG